MTNKNQKPIELAANLLNQVSGGCNHKCACEALIDDIKGIPDDIKGIPDKISAAMPDLHNVEERVKKVPGKVNRLIHNL